MYTDFGNWLYAGIGGWINADGDYVHVKDNNIFILCDDSYYFIFMEYKRIGNLDIYKQIPLSDSWNRSMFKCGTNDEAHYHIWIKSKCKIMGDNHCSAL